MRCFRYRVFLSVIPFALTLGCGRSADLAGLAGEDRSVVASPSAAAVITDVQVEVLDFSAGLVQISFDPGGPVAVSAEVHHGETALYGFVQPAVEIEPGRYAATFVAAASAFHYKVVVDAAETGDQAFTILIPDALALAASPDVITVAGSSEVTASVTSQGSPVVGCRVTFKVGSGKGNSGGSVTPTSKVTDAAGKASTTFTASKPGAIKIQADCDGRTESVKVVVKNDSPPHPNGGVQ